MHRKLILMSFAATVLATCLTAKPNFSGTWVLNVSKSDFGPLPGPSNETTVIEHNDPTLKVAVKAQTAQGDQDFVLNFTTDGQEATNQQGPLTLKSKLSWDGDSLVVDSTTSLQGNDITIKQVWTLSADGKTLTQNAHLSAAALGEADQKLVFEKSAGDAAAASAGGSNASRASAPAAGASAATHANYSGTWKLNIEKSDFGPLPPSNSRTDIIQHTDPMLKDSVSDDGAQGKQEYVLAMTTDGKEATNKAGELEVKNTASWDGANLVVDTKLSFQGTDVAVKATWVLSPDGKTLTQNAHITAGALGEADQKFIFEKQ
ncbi:MAG TPA: hypothetical protein VKX49_28630 [Bryobacteraceae bacterium]|nr:hypothetical protein [Bryobacteraceae bacterium]